MFQRYAYTQHQRHSEHALVADETDFQPYTVVDRCDKGNEAIEGEVGMANRLARLAENLAEVQLDMVTVRQELPTAAIRHRIEQTIGRY